MKPAVSIIVPIYNMEKYLGRCLDSLLAQTLNNIEILTVNDGSTDSSLEILKEYSIKDGRIKIVDMPNGGVSAARNEGIKFVSGDFIGFLDPDDWVDLEMYEVMYNHAINEKADIVMCTYMREFKSHSKVKNFDLPNKLLYKDEEVRTNVMRRLIGPLHDEIANPELLDAWGTVWSKIYRTEIIQDNDIEFLDLTKIGSNEDTLFNIETSYFAKSFLFLNNPYYHYWKGNSSSVTSGYKPRLMEQWFYLFSYIENFLKEKNMDKNYYFALNNRICLNTLGLGLNTISHDNQSSHFSKIKKIHTFLNDKRIKHSFKQLELSKFPIVWRVFYFCAKTRFSIGFYLMLFCINTLRKVIK